MSAFQGQKEDREGKEGREKTERKGLGQAGLECCSEDCPRGYWRLYSKGGSAEGSSVEDLQAAFCSMDRFN